MGGCGGFIRIIVTHFSITKDSLTNQSFISTKRNVIIFSVHYQKKCDMSIIRTRRVYCLTILV